MIYLIGGPPKCGKTTLAKQLAKKLGIQWVETDTLEVIGREYIGRYTTKKEFARLYPHSAMKGKNNDETYARATTQQIMKNLIAQARPTEGVIDVKKSSMLKNWNVVCRFYSQRYSTTGIAESGTSI